MPEQPTEDNSPRAALFRDAGNRAATLESAINIIHRERSRATRKQLLRVASEFRERGMHRSGPHAAEAWKAVVHEGERSVRPLLRACLAAGVRDAIRMTAYVQSDLSAFYFQQAADMRRDFEGYGLDTLIEQMRAQSFAFGTNVLDEANVLLGNRPKVGFWERAQRSDNLVSVISGVLAIASTSFAVWKSCSHSPESAVATVAIDAGVAANSALDASFDDSSAP